jgi:hypothetical protein
MIPSSFSSSSSFSNVYFLFCFLVVHVLFHFIFNVFFSLFFFNLCLLFLPISGAAARPASATPASPAQPAATPDLNTLRADADRELQKMTPLLEAAMAALNSLSMADITEMKALKNPPAACALVGEAVCIMFASKKTAWTDAQKLFGGKNFVDQLKSFDKNNVAPAVLQKLAPFMNNPDFEVANVSSKSKAAAGLCSWVRAMYSYAQIHQRIGPMFRAVEEASRLEAEARPHAAGMYRVGSGVLTRFSFLLLLLFLLR